MNSNDIDIFQLAEIIATELTVEQLQQLKKVLAADYNIRFSITRPDNKYNLVLEEIGDNRLMVVKIVWKQMGFGLKEADALVQPNKGHILLMNGITRDKAEILKRELEYVGATVSIRLSV